MDEIDHLAVIGRFQARVDLRLGFVEARVRRLEVLRWVQLGVLAVVLWWGWWWCG